jgi:eIF4-gamma/eIF5/eIF2-epsilon
MHKLLGSNPSKAQILAQLQKEREEHKLDDEQTARLAFLALFDANVFKQLKTDKLDVLKGAVTNSDGQTGVLGGITELGKDAAVLKVVPHVLKLLYDEDLLEEEAILKWHSGKFRGDALKVKEASKVFVEWLQYVTSHFLFMEPLIFFFFRNADEESEDEEEDEEAEEEEEEEEEDSD